MINVLSALILIAAILMANQVASAQTWHADNGDGTYTNPLFYDEFSDPDMIRVGDDFYLTGTTMHAMPGLPILHSKDLVNWTLVTYVFDTLDLGPAFRLEGGKSVYGRGIWAPSFRFHNGTYYIFSNVNGYSTQLYTATDIKGPWTHRAMKKSFHDLSVLFDDDGKVYVAWGYRNVHFARLNEDLTDIVPGTEKIIIAAKTDEADDVGEGIKFLKIGKTYYLITAWWKGRMRMPAARSDKPDGPYEINPEISADEDFGLAEGHRLVNEKLGFPYNMVPQDPKRAGRMSMHQGAIIETPAGEWWGYSMMDYNSVGRLLCLSPVTWKDGWPYFGLAGNLGRSPRTWIRPKTAQSYPTTVPYQRSDDFAGPKLNPVWQWSHVPVDGKWSLVERPGYLRLHAMPAGDLWAARNTLTQRSIGPISTPTAVLDASGLADGDVAGLALLNYPYAWLGVRREEGKLSIRCHDQNTGKTDDVATDATRVWLRADCDFLRETATFSYSTDGKAFTPIGGPFTMIFQGRTFQGVRYSLFSFNTTGVDGGHADFDALTVDEAHPRGLMKPIPYGRAVTITGIEGDLGLVVHEGKIVALPVKTTPASAFTVEDRGLGRVAFRNGDRYLSVDDTQAVTLKAGAPGDGEAFQWTETPYGDLVLLSIRTHRLFNIDPSSRSIRASSPGPRPDRKDGTWLRFATVDSKE